MSTRRRAAEFVANLIVVDEPQLFLLKAGKSHIVALAVEPEAAGGTDYVAASVTSRNWGRYIDGFVDLLYLFSYPFQRRLYKFKESDWKDDRIMMTLHEGEFPDAALPIKGLFSRAHTEPYRTSEKPSGQEQLFIDGEWELNEFGSFYQKYSDIYSLEAVLTNANDSDIAQIYKGKASLALTNRPYRGGSSYLHVFDELPRCLPREQRLNLDGIEYNSPGDVRILGDDEKLASVEQLISAFLPNRSEIRERYDALRGYLSEKKLLTAPASSLLEDDPNVEAIKRRTESLAEAMSFDRLEVLTQLCGNNQLVASKVILALYRRLDAASAFFAEGRMAFERGA